MFCHINKYSLFVPVLCHVELVDVALLVSRHEPVAMATKGHSSELQVSALGGQANFDVAGLKQQPGEGKIYGCAHHPVIDAMSV